MGPLGLTPLRGTSHAKLGRQGPLEAGAGLCTPDNTIRCLGLTLARPGRPLSPLGHRADHWSWGPA